MTQDMVNHPAHYNSHPSGVEVIEITRHLSFTIGTAFKYIARFDKKWNPVEDLRKAVWYTQTAIDGKYIFPIPFVCGDREVLKKNLEQYVAAEPDMQVVGLLSLFQIGVLRGDTHRDEGIEALKYLIYGLEHKADALQVPN